MNKLHVIKIGGQVLEDKNQMELLVNSISKLKIPSIIVHGGGKKASALSLKLGLKPNMIEGRRVTSAADLEVVTMVYAGLMNKTLVSHLQQKGVNAIGLSGADGRSILAEKRPIKEVNYGFVGDVKKVNAEFIKGLLEQKLTPVFCALTYNNGSLLNTNADTIATEVAKAMSKFYKVELTYCFEKHGVLKNADDDSSLLAFITSKSFLQLKSNGQIHSGMIPKLENGFRALDGGVTTVKIGSIEAVNSTSGFYTKIEQYKD